MKGLGLLALTLGSTVFGNTRAVIPPEGLTRLSEYIMSEFLNDIHDWRLPAARSTVGGFKLSVNDVVFSAEVTGLDIRPEHDAIRVELSFRNGRIQAGSVNARKDLLVPVSATCHRTEIVQRGPEAKVVGRYAVTLDRGKILIQQLSITCDLNPANLSIEGPGRCSGAMGVGRLVRKAVRSYLKKSMGKITRKIESRLAKELPAAQKAINARVRRQFSIGAAAEFAPDAAFSLEPLRLEIAPEAVSADFRLFVESKNTEAATSVSSKDMPSTDFMVGKLGVSPLFIAETATRALEATHQQPLELAPLVGQIETFLSVGVEEVLGVSGFLAVVERPGWVQWLPSEKKFLVSGTRILLLDRDGEEELLNLEVDLEVRSQDEGRLVLVPVPGGIVLRSSNPRVSEQSLGELETHIQSLGEIEILSPVSSLPLGDTGLRGSFQGLESGMLWVTIDDSRL